MPLLGSDSTLASLLKQEIISENQKRGLQPPDTQALDALTTAIARAVISHFISNTQVQPGIEVATSGGAGATVKPGLIT